MKKKPVSHVAVILDRSGSMAACLDQTISGFNEYLTKLKLDENVEHRMTLVQFDHEYTVCADSVPIAQMKPLTKQTYVPRGWTALYDACGRVIQTLSESCGKDSVLCIIITDGQENSSKDWHRARLFSLIKEKEATGKWTFVFLGADQDAMQASSSIGIPIGNTMNYASSQTFDMYTTLASATSTRSMNSSAGASSTTAFFVDDEENKKRKDNASPSS